MIKKIRSFVHSFLSVEERFKRILDNFIDLSRQEKYPIYFGTMSQYINHDEFQPYLFRTFIVYKGRLLMTSGYFQPNAFWNKQQAKNELKILVRYAEERGAQAVVNPILLETPKKKYLKSLA